MMRPDHLPGVRILLSLAALLALGAAGCGDGGGGGDGPTPGDRDGGADAFIPPKLDTDGDLITDYQEGAAASQDTDGDGTGDYLDLDSDGDGIPDAVEAGDTDLGTAPVDTDGDLIPDFRDGDSDNDGLADGAEDLDRDGVLDPGETDPRDDDSDDDGVTDLVEDVAGTDPRDPADNPQARGNFVFLVPFGEPADPPEDVLRFRTSITKVDLYFLEDISVSMDQELLAIRANVVATLDELTCDPGETPASCPADCPATCGDGTCDPAESPTSCPDDCLGLCGDGACVGNENVLVCAMDCPGTCGDGVCASGETPATCSSDCPGTCGDGFCHAGEQASVTACIDDIHSGVGVFGTTSSTNARCLGATSCAAGANGSFAYRNLLDVQGDSAATQAALPDNCWGTGCWEPGLAATFFAVTGLGTAGAIAAFGGPPTNYIFPPLVVPEPAPCAAGFRGYPCFRPDSLPIILLIGDEAFSQCYLPDGDPAWGNCGTAIHPTMTPRTFPHVAGAVNALGAKVIGIQGAGGGSALTLDFQTLALETGSVNAAGDPLVFLGADAAAAPAIADGVRELAAGLPLDMVASIRDDPADAVDAVAEFVAFLDTFDPGTAECMTWPDKADSDGDSHLDEYVGVTAGKPVCWKIHVRQNETVPATGTVQLFRATVHLTGNDVMPLDARTVYFVVPPDLSGPVVE